MNAADVVIVAALVVAWASVGYLVAAQAAVRHFLTRVHGARPAREPVSVTVLKPLYGLDPELEENLRAYCEQDHPRFQIVFGVRDGADPAAAVARRVIADHPDLDLELVVDERVCGTNYKVANLANMAPRIRHGVVLIADSDMRPSPDHLAKVLSPFADPAVGAVTCLYSGSAAPAPGAASRFASRLGAMFINDWFLPSVRLSLALRAPRFCLGATMAVRREVLESIGGFEALADDLADDYLLGRRVDAAGHRVAVADVVVENVLVEPGLGALFAHELRWSRTMRAMEPAGFAAAILTDALPLTALAAVAVLGAGGPATLAFAPFGAAAAVRIAGHVRVARTLGVRQGPTPWLIPLRDLLTLAVRVASFIPGRVEWRGHTFGVDAEGRLHTPGHASRRPPHRTEHERVPAS